MIMAMMMTSFSILRLAEGTDDLISVFFRVIPWLRCGVDTFFPTLLAFTAEERAAK